VLARAPGKFLVEERHDQVLDVPERAQGRSAEILQRVQSWRRHEARARHRGIAGKNGRTKATPAKALGGESSHAVIASWLPKM
jgi:hypothetical protein